MKLFKDEFNKIYAYESDGSQDNLIGNKIQISESEANILIYNSTPDSEKIKNIESAIMTHMDSVAQAKRYDNRDSCRLYAGYVNPFQSEAIAFGQWVSACWVASNIAQAAIIAGTRSIPTPEEAVAELPLMVWPV